jgi:hypothetical protein
MMPVAVQGASSSTASKPSPRRPGGRIGLHQLGGELHPGQVLPQPAEPPRVALHRHDRRAGGRELRRLAARCRAEIRHPLPRPRAEQPGRQGGRGVLHPEAALGEARQLGRAGAGGQAGGAGRQDLGAFGGRGAGGQRQVERRGMAMRPRDGAHRPAIGGVPRRPEPGRRVEPLGVQSFQRRGSLGRDLAEHRIDQAGEGRRHHRDGRGDGGMRRGAEQQQFGGPHPQRGADDGRRLAPQEGLQHRVQAAGPAQHGRRDAVRRRAVAGGEGGRQRVERFLERAAAFHHGGEQRERRLPRGGAGGGAGGCGAARGRAAVRGAAHRCTGLGRAARSSWTVWHEARFMAPRPGAC